MGTKITSQARPQEAAAVTRLLPTYGAVWFARLAKPAIRLASPSRFG
jgi:hypothetical protein